MILLYVIFEIENLKQKCSNVNMSNEDPGILMCSQIDTFQYDFVSHYT